MAVDYEIHELRDEIRRLEEQIKNLQLRYGEMGPRQDVRVFTPDPQQSPDQTAESGDAFVWQGRFQNYENFELANRTAGLSPLVCQRMFLEEVAFRVGRDGSWVIPSSNIFWGVAASGGIPAAGTGLVDGEEGLVPVTFWAGHGNVDISQGKQVLYVRRQRDRMVLTRECEDPPEGGGLPDQTPTNLSPVAGSTVNTNAQISWDVVGGVPQTFDLWWGTTGGGLVKVLDGSPAQTFDPGTLTAGTNYAYVVVSYNAAGEPIQSPYTAFWAGPRAMTPQPVAVTMAVNRVGRHAYVGPRTPGAQVITMTNTHAEVELP